jgi:hypothetical protein
MKRTRPLTGLALLALLGLTTPALASARDAPPWAATVRAGVFVLRSPGIAGHPAGPDVELSLGRTIYELVSVELNAGAYTAMLTGTGTRLTVVPLTVSLKMMAAPELGFEAYAVAGLGVDLTRFGGGMVGTTTTSQIAFHAGLGVRRMLGESLYAGLDGRYVFQDATGPAAMVGRLDGLRLSALAGALF